MKTRALLTGIAALFLATGTAHAESKLDQDLAWWCNNPETVEQCEIFRKARVSKPFELTDYESDEVLRERCQNGASYWCGVLEQRKTERAQEELGRQYKCDGAYVDASDETVDNIYIKHNHLLSDLSSHTVTIFTRTGSGRRHRSTEPRFRYPVVHYDVYTGKLTLNGKRCKPIPEDELDAPKG